MSHKGKAPSRVSRAPPGRASLEGIVYQDKNFPSYQRWVENSSVNPPLPWFKPILIKWQTYLEQRSTLSASPLSLKMWVLLCPIECVDLLNATVLITVVAPVAYREGVE